MDEYWGQDFQGIQRLNIMDFLLNENPTVNSGKSYINMIKEFLNSGNSPFVLLPFS